MALTPFYAITARAAAPQASADDRMLNNNAQNISSVAQAAQTGNLAGFAAQQASGLATQELQAWLQGFGTARVEFGTDNNFKPRDGAIDLLLPLHKDESRLLFTQNGIRNKDGQITGNFGLGQRHFTGDWMLGYNAFYDQNFTRDHKRFGTGVEAWRDYLKLSGNGYFRLSGWRNSVDLEDYDARPANGFDLRAEAWLPAYPALGGKLMYEKYYGDEVALFGKDRRQKNPDAVTAGLSYTPVPLLSFTADHRKGGSQDDTRLGLQLMYQFGQPLSAQLDPAGVGLKRTLAGSGMDLVERNNNIVLEYRKQQTIDLTLPQEIAGAGGATVPVSYQLTSKYGLTRIDWNDAALVAAGGKMTDMGGGQYQLTLPRYTAGSANSWPLSAMAWDTRDNASRLAATTVSVSRPGVSTDKSSVVSALDTILANGAATTTITITLQDESGLPVTDMAADLSATVQEQPAGVSASNAKAVKKALTQVPAQPATLSEVEEQGNGVYTLTLTAGTRPRQAVVSPLLGEQPLGTVTVSQISDADSAEVKDGDLKLDVDSAVANGSDTNHIRARVTDATGNPVAGVEVNFTLSGSARVSADSSLTQMSDSEGYISLRFTNTVAELVNVTATTATGSAQVQATFTADSGSAQPEDGSLTADRDTAVADGRDAITYSVNVKDANGNPVPGVTVNWLADGGKLAADSSHTDASGVAQISLTSLQAIPVIVSAIVNGGAAVQAQPVAFTADSDNLNPGNSAMAAIPATIVANGTTASTVTLTLKDANENPVSGQAVTFTSDLGNVSNVVDNQDGTYSATLTGTTSGIAAVSASVSGNAFTVTPASVTLTADSDNLDTTKSVMAATPATIVANETESSAITLTLKDINDNPVSDQSVVFTSTLGTVSNVVDNQDGTYSATLNGTIAGTASISASVGGNAFSVLPASVALTADSSNPDYNLSTLTASETSIVANGIASSVITLALKDIYGNPIAGQSITLSTTLAGSTLGTVNDNGDGTYSATLTGTTADTESISAFLAGKTFAVTPVNVTLTADASNPDSGKSALSASEASIVADGTAASVITLTLKDVHDNPTPGQAVTFSTTLSGSNLGTVIDNGNGTYSAALTGTTAGNETVIASVNGTALTTPGATVTLIGDGSNPDSGKSALSASEASIVANGTAASVITLSLKDANHNPTPGQAVTFTTTLTGSTMGSVTDNGDGTYAATLTSTSAGSAAITVTVGGNALAGTTATITANPIPVDLTLSVDNTRKNIGESISLTVNAVRKGTNTPAQHVKISFTATEVLNRQNVVATSGELKLNGLNMSAYQGVTNASGQIIIPITDPNGTGVKTTLRATSDNGDINSQSVTFNVKTSPNVASANMWGHMPETLTAEGITFRRPYLQAEKAGINSAVHNNEEWSNFTHSAATAMCTIPSEVNIRKLYNAYPSGTIESQQGWPLYNVFRTSTVQSGSTHYRYIYMDTGRVTFKEGTGNTTGYGVVCQN